MAETKNFMAKLVRAWPALPYMALGALLASVYIASSGTAWLSDSETNGGNLSVLTVTTSLSAGGLMLLSTFAVPRVRSWLERPTACLWAGAVSSLGALIVILIGPYYLTPMLPYPVIRSLFFIGGILFGVGLGAIALRCGQLYGALPPRQVILYVAYSQFVVGASFFIVLGSPPGRRFPAVPAWRHGRVRAAAFGGRHLGIVLPLYRAADAHSCARPFAPVAAEVVLEASGRGLRVLLHRVLGVRIHGGGLLHRDDAVRVASRHARAHASGVGFGGGGRGHRGGSTQLREAVLGGDGGLRGACRPACLW